MGEGGSQREGKAELDKYPPFTVNLMRLMGEFEETREKRGDRTNAFQHDKRATNGAINVRIHFVSGCFIFVIYFCAFDGKNCT